MQNTSLQKRLSVLLHASLSLSTFIVDIYANLSTNTRTYMAYIKLCIFRQLDTVHPAGIFFKIIIFLCRCVLHLLFAVFPKLNF
jgi:hypothetical protein